MLREIVFKASFIRTYHRLSEAEQHLVDRALKHFEQYLQKGEAPMGLGIRHLGNRIYEFRVGLALRVVYVPEGGQVVIYLLGTHDEVRRFLKRS